MRVAVLLVLALCATCAFALEDLDLDLEPLASVPPVSDVVTSPFSPPPADASTPSSAPTSTPTGDEAVTFEDPTSATADPSSSSLSSLSNTGSEYDGQIEEVQQTLNKLKGSIKESEACAHRLTEQRAQYRSLQSQLDHLQREKEKKILEDKLSRQMRDLEEINHMSRSLRQKYNELKRTQQLIRTRMTGTRTSLSQLDEEDTEGDDTVIDNGAHIAAEMDAMHQMQAKILETSHFKNSEAVQKHIKLSERLNSQAMEAQGLKP